MSCVTNLNRATYAVSQLIKNQLRSLLLARARENVENADEGHGRIPYQIVHFSAHKLIFEASRRATAQ